MDFVHPAASAGVGHCRPRRRASTRASHNAGDSRIYDDWPVGLSVLIVDDHEDFRRSAGALLELDGFRVIGEAGDASEAFTKARDMRPDVVLLDIQLPDLDGFAVAERIALLEDPPMVILVSSRDGTVYGSRLAASPARGFIAKRHLSGAALASLLA
jgi:DNA-binding NarL/FixJ family response regulator